MRRPLNVDGVTMASSDTTQPSETATADAARHDWWPEVSWRELDVWIERQGCTKCFAKRLVCGEETLRYLGPEMCDD